MLEKLRIQNFKGWMDTGTIRMAPITLFFGANSSGKSSIGQFLMMLKQTAETPDRKAVFNPGGKNAPVQLGTFQDMVFNQDTKRKIAFDYSWRLNEPTVIEDPSANEKYRGERLSFEARVGIRSADRQALTLEHMRYRLRHDQKDVLSIGLAQASEAKEKAEYKVEASGYNLMGQQGKAFSSAVRFYGFPDEVVANFQNAGFVQTLSLLHENLFRSIYYLGPLRNKAERLYTWGGTEPESVGSSGENTIAAILAARDRKISFSPKGPAKAFDEVIAEKLLQMDLIHAFKVGAISSQRQDYEVKVQTRGSRNWVDLTDVGFGVSQVLPILVECFYAPRDSIIIVEQPEVHLHPRAQAALADVLIDVVQARENGRERNIQLVIETHSEHFLRRLQRRIAEDVISQAHVAAYFANVDKTPAYLSPLQIDEFGAIKNWPANFFGDEMSDIAEQSKAALKKRLKEVKR